jgi:hypothetical protein
VKSKELWESYLLGGLPAIPSAQQALEWQVRHVPQMLCMHDAESTSAPAMFQKSKDNGRRGVPARPRDPAAVAQGFERASRRLGVSLTLGACVLTGVAQETGSVLLARTADEAIDLQKRAVMLEAAGVRAELVGLRTLRSLEPALDLGAQGAALLVETDAQLVRRCLKIALAGSKNPSERSALLCNAARPHAVVAGGAGPCAPRLGPGPALPRQEMSDSLNFVTCFLLLH